VLGLLRRVVVCDVADVSEVHAASNLTVEVLDIKDGGSMYLQNVGNIAHDHMAEQPTNRINNNTFAQTVCLLCVFIKLS
jgi:hypothetical protein